MQHIILLRGVNVGGRTLKMDELKVCLEKAGYKNVITVLQTGNIILESDTKNQTGLSQSLKTLLFAIYHFNAQLITLSPSLLKSILEKNPFHKVQKDFHRYIVFTKNEFEKDIAENHPWLDNKTEEVRIGNGVIYWNVKKGFTLESSFGKYIAKVSTKEFTTTRNCNTLEKILKKCKV